MKLKELDEIELSESELKECEEQMTLLQESLAEGGGRVDPECAQPSEALLSGLF